MTLDRNRLADCRRRASDDSGFSMIELLVAMLVLAIAIVALAGTLDGSRSLANTGERLTAASAVAEQQLETVLGRTYQDFDNFGQQNPLARVVNDEVLQYVCGVSTGDTRPSFRFDQSTCPSTSPFGEEQVVVGNLGVDERKPWDDSRSGARGEVFTFITEVDDDCADAPRNDVACVTEDMRRVTVMVTASNGEPNRPVVLTTLVPNPEKLPSDCTGCVNPYTFQGLRY